MHANGHNGLLEEIEFGGERAAVLERAPSRLHENSNVVLLLVVSSQTPYVVTIEQEDRDGSVHYFWSDYYRHILDGIAGFKERSRPSGLAA